jgi:hypothetical protein
MIVTEWLILLTSLLMDYGIYNNKLIILDNSSSHINKIYKRCNKKIIIYYMMFNINIIQMR